jgi:hypothetical protein
VRQKERVVDARETGDQSRDKRATVVSFVTQRSNNAKATSKPLSQSNATKESRETVSSAMTTTANSKGERERRDSATRMANTRRATQLTADCDWDEDDLSNTYAVNVEVYVLLWFLYYGSFIMVLLIFLRCGVVPLVLTISRDHRQYTLDHAGVFYMKLLPMLVSQPNSNCSFCGVALDSGFVFGYFLNVSYCFCFWFGWLCFVFSDTIE